MILPARGVAVALGMVVLGAAFAGCGDDGGDVERADGSTTTESTATTTTTQPPATDAEAVRPVIEALVQDYDAAMADVLVDPEQVDDPESSVLADLEAVFTPDELEARLTTLRDNAEAGRLFEPLGDEPMGATFLVGEIVADGADSLEVLVCTTYHYRRTGPDGGEQKDGLSHPGRLYAERVDGAWRIAQGDQDPMQVCDPAAAEEAA